MDITQLKLNPIDFSNKSKWSWILRRTTIGLLLCLYYLYALSFVMMLVLASFTNAEKSTSTNVEKSNMSTSANLEGKVPEQSQTLSSEFSDFAYITKNHMILMVTFGFLGSVFFITRTFVRTVNKIDFPVVWYITRPLQGILMALFIYFAFRSGQFIFYSGGGQQIDEKTINVYTLSILAIAAGMFTENAYEKLYTIARRMLYVKKKDTELA